MPHESGDPATSRRIFSAVEIIAVIEKASTYLQSHLKSNCLLPDEQLIELGNSLLRLCLQAIDSATRHNSPEDIYRRGALLDIMSAAIQPILHFVSDLPAQTPQGHVARAGVLLAWGGFLTVEPKPGLYVDLEPEEEDVASQITLALCIDVVKSAIDTTET